MNAKDFEVSTETTLRARIEGLQKALATACRERDEARGEVADLLSQLDAAGFESRRVTQLVEALKACADALQCHNQDDDTPEQFQNHWCNRCDEYADRSGEVRMKARALIRELGLENNNVPT
jgi:chorismate mutase